MTVTVTPAVLNHLSNTPRGTFMAINGYENSHGEVSNYIVQQGIKYENILKRDFDTLMGLKDESRIFNVKHNFYIEEELIGSLFENANADSYDAVFVTLSKIDSTDSSGVFEGIINLNNPLISNRKSKARIMVSVSYALQTYSEYVCEIIGYDNASEKSSMLFKYLNEVDKTPASYSENVSLVVKDVLIISKKVTEKGEYALKGSLPASAVKEAIRNNYLLADRYRSFTVREGFVDSIKVNKAEIAFNDNGELEVVESIAV